MSLGEEGQAYVYNAAGMLVLYKDGKQIGRVDAEVPHVKEMLGQSEGNLYYTKEDGDIHAVHFKQLPDMKWWVCLEVSTTEIYAPVNRLFMISAVLVLLCGLVVGLIIFFNMRGVARGCPAHPAWSAMWRTGICSSRPLKMSNLRATSAVATS